MENKEKTHSYEVEIKLDNVNPQQLEQINRILDSFEVEGIRVKHCGWYTN